MKSMFNTRRGLGVALSVLATSLAACGGAGNSSGNTQGSNANGLDGAAPAAQAAVAGITAARYVLVNVGSGKCVDVAGASLQDGGNIQQYSCNGSAAQSFDASEVSAGVFSFRNVGSGKVIDVASASLADGANIQQWSSNGSDAQRFRLQRTQGNQYALVNQGSGKCMDVAAASTADGANIQQYACNGTSAQQFFLVPFNTTRAALPVGEYAVSAESSGLCLEPAAGSTADGAKLLQQTCNASAAQRFEVTADQTGSYRIQNVQSGKVLDVTDVSTINGALIQQWTAGGGANQRFSIETSGAGYRVRPTHAAGKCLDVKDLSTAPGGSIQQWDCAGSSNQRWRFTPTGESVGNAPDFGPNVLVFDPSMAASTIQAQLDRVFREQESNQFGTARYALLFKPGSYRNTVRVGFYTQVQGLGISPDDVSISGAVQADAAWFGGNATQNFWRAAENLAVTPDGGINKWAVSQAAPFRRMHVRGGMVLDDGGWSSGGLIADSRVDGQVNSGGQQQWLTRNSQIGNWTGGGWNMVFVGTDGAPTTSNWPNPPYTTVATTPVVREKPFLTYANGEYKVFVPALRSNTRGASWANGAAAGEALPLSNFYIAQAGRDTAQTLNAALTQGKHLLFTPGVYHLTDTLRVTRANTVVLGLGLATLTADGGVTAMTVADVDGVKIAGLLFDAGLVSSPVLLDVGPQGASADHAANPTSLHDVFFRVGGAAEGRAAVSLRINSHDVIGDHTWVWRGDHSYGVGWNLNTTTNGLVVNGDDVTIYGLFVEHYHQYQTLWNGNGGRTYFYQSEAPYDVPNQAAWMSSNGNGYASYKVANGVTRHEAWGLGVYCYFSANRGVKLGSAIEAPTASGVSFHNMTTLSLGGVGEITHVLNNRGGTANASSVTARLSQ